MQALLLSLGGAQALTALEACWQQQTTNQPRHGPLLTTPARETAAAPTAAPARGRAAAESHQDSARQEGAMRQESPGRGRVAQRPALHTTNGPGGGRGSGEGKGRGATKGAEAKGQISPPYLGQLKPRGAGQRRGEAEEAAEEPGARAGVRAGVRAGARAAEGRGAEGKGRQRAEGSGPTKGGLSQVERVPGAEGQGAEGQGAEGQGAAKATGRRAWESVRRSISPPSRPPPAAAAPPPAAPPAAPLAVAAAAAAAPETALAGGEGGRGGRGGQVAEGVPRVERPERPASRVERLLDRPSPPQAPGLRATGDAYTLNP